MLSFFYRRINRLSFQLLASFWLVIFTTLSITFVLLHFLDSHGPEKLESEELRTYHKQILSVYRTNQIYRILGFAKNSLPTEETSDLHAVLFNPDTKEIAGTSADEYPDVQNFIFRSNDFSNPMVQVVNERRIVGPFSVNVNLINEHNEPKDVAYLMYFVSPVDTHLVFLSYLFAHPFLVMLIIALASTPVLLLLAWRIGIPIRRFRQAAELVSLGQFVTNPDLENKGPIELRQVGKSLNHMTTSLAELLDTHQRLVSSISHELRTPLTRLQLAVALLRRRVGEYPETKRIEMESERLDKMINDLLLLSRNQLRLQLERDYLTVDSIWNEVIEDAEFEAEHRKIDFTFIQLIKHPERYLILGDKEALASALENILRNALKYTNNKIVALMTLKKSDLMMIIVDDNGAGVSEQEYERIFKPFYRVDEARTRTTGGTGLGLAIVVNTVQQHQGRVWAEKSPFGGLRIVMELPLATEK
ncbi:envelope stress sensor histidine kinase CpxA [Exercitatus varius]|uniref:histidine kinase n=1 Tax=Exercitatus varius TaxID=67857 RepID=A0AAW6Q921_9PAST|nr:envelope stress sensor histidine kinase CpxA [Exercitatus varius]MDG2941749.1 envelope stress sensor histidine kinase CpxA [Exercitatus varius]MDG2949936.1 envelope stress sensor histidine kinase CpxA [Exercitatus varius]MDG2952865.1 envelope stress sensor histidine kinase CpxA [Exercitatus varius]MDG2961833.1 envelope stress sensor histidine kinase CpxA [Exercitatus varius]